MISKFAQWQEALADIEFAKEIFQMEKAAAKSALAAKGYEFTDEEMDEFIAAIKNYIAGVNMDELSEGDLESVAGGGHIGSFLGGIATGIGAAVVGFVIGLASW